jgi:hypothetical protein
MKTKVSILPIWRITVTDKIYYFVLGTSKKSIIDSIKNNSENLILDGNYIKISQIEADQSKKILLQIDVEDEDSYTTLFDEALYFTEHNLERDFFLATSFDVIADLSLNKQNL